MDLPKTLSSNLAFLTQTVSKKYRRVFDNEMRLLGLTRPQWWLLTHIHYFGGVSQAELADLLDVDKSGIKRILEALEKKGWIERIPHARDGRIVKISLSPRIRQLMEGITALSDLLVKQSLGGLSNAKIEKHFAGLSKISDSLDAMITTSSPEAIELRQRIQKDLKGLDRKPRR